MRAILALQERRILFVDLDQFDQVPDTELGDRHHAVVADPVDYVFHGIVSTDFTRS